jgi:hypothetical protein
VLEKNLPVPKNAPARPLCTNTTTTNIGNVVPKASLKEAAAGRNWTKINIIPICTAHKKQ